MKVFVAGATGVLGRRVVRQLDSDGIDVVGLSRSSVNTAMLRELGAEVRPGDLFDRDSVLDVTTGCDVIAHLATSIPVKTRTAPADWAVNDRLRREGTENLTAAALHHGCQLYIQESVTFHYGDRRGDWVDEETPLDKEPLAMLRSAVDMEQIVKDATSRGGLPATILRFSGFYGHDSRQTRTMLYLTSKRRFPVLGKGDAYWNLIHADDAAAAVVQCVKRVREAAGKTFVITDDEPATARQLLDELASLLGAKRPLSIPPFVARLLLGAETTRYLLASVRCRNARVKKILSWRPRFPTYREGFRAILGQERPAG